MRYKGDIGLYLSGAPVPLPKCALFITQPTVRQIAQFGETSFLTAVHLITRTDEYLEQIKMGNPELANKADFQLLMIMINEDKSIQKYLNSFFELTFPDYNISYDKNAISFSLKKDKQHTVCGMVTLYSFESFQTTIRELFSADVKEEEQDYNPANEAAARIAKKLKQGRQKAQEEENGTDANISLFGTYASILSIGLQMDINIFYNYTPFQIMDSFKRYWEKDKNDFYRKISTTPMMDTSKIEEPKEWTRNLYPAETVNN